MTDALRRSLVLLIVLALSAGIFAAASHLRDPQRTGLLHFLNKPSAKKTTPQTYTLAPPAETLPGLTALSQEYANLMDRVRPAVVSINTQTEFSNVKIFGDASHERPGLGSGMIVTKEGHVLTNQHVVDNVDEISITTNAGRTYNCERIGYRVDNDLAVLKIIGDEGEEFHPLSFGDSDKVRVGEIVFAIGNPFGLGETVTQGIISSLPRPLFDEADFKTFQSDTVINPGNSGGPLINTNGEIIGVSTAIYTNSADQSYAGVSLAIPSNDAREIFADIMADGAPEKAYLGIRKSRDLTEYQRSYFNAPHDRGILVEEVTEGSPADKAGLKRGDLVLNFAGRPIGTVEELIGLIGKSTIGKPLPMQIIAGGRPGILEVTLVPLEEFFTPKSPGNSEEAVAKISDALGITVRNLTVYQRRRFGLSAASPGIVVTEINPSANLAQKLGPGDIIYSLNDTPVRTAAQFNNLIDELPLGREARLFYYRYIGNRPIRGIVRFTPNPK